ncbi:hypothetical protein DFH09DRAFT_1098555 [Mycena vulgaris]|nr:hypothetical protein DFH09DRAFT_1098555 [Mycena vulgaris]
MRMADAAAGEQATSRGVTPTQSSVHVAHLGVADGRNGQQHCRSDHAALRGAYWREAKTARTLSRELHRLMRAAANGACTLLRTRQYLLMIERAQLSLHLEDVETRASERPRGSILQRAAKEDNGLASDDMLRALGCLRILRHDKANYALPFDSVEIGFLPEQAWHYQGSTAIVNRFFSSPHVLCAVQLPSAVFTAVSPLWVPVTRADHDRKETFFVPPFVSGMQRGWGCSCDPYPNWSDHRAIGIG